MPAVVLVGHDHDCPLCGPTTVDSGSESFKVNGRAIARVGDALGCGAVITSGLYGATCCRGAGRPHLTRSGERWLSAVPFGEAAAASGRVWRHSAVLGRM